MKTTLLLFVCCISLAGYSQVSESASQDFKKIEWLIGTWSRTNISKPGKTSHERWEKIEQNHFRGIGVTMQGQDTVFVEKISLLIKDNSIYYVADVPENKQPVYFKLTSITLDGFVCENPQHDFPKVISYQLKDKTLKAQISGGGKQIDYIFVKQ